MMVWPARAIVCLALLMGHPALADSSTSGVAAPAGDAALSPPLAPSQPIDLAAYTCQDMMQDMVGKSVERIGIAILLSLAIDRQRAEPTNLTFDLGSVKLVSERVGRSCAVGDRSRQVLQVVAEEAKSAIAAPAK